MKIKLLKWDTRTSKKVFKLKCKKIKNWDQDNLTLLEEAHQIRFRSHRSRIQIYEIENDGLLRGWRLTLKVGHKKFWKSFQIEMLEIQELGSR